MVVSLEKEGDLMVKLSIEVHSGTARFAVAIQAQSIEQVLNIVTTRYRSSVTRGKLPIEKSILVEDSAA